MMKPEGIHDVTCHIQVHVIHYLNCGCVFSATVVRACTKWLSVRRMPIPGCGDGHGSLVVDHVVCDDGLIATVRHQRGNGYKSRVFDLYHDEAVAWLGVVRGGEDAPCP